MIYDAYHPFVGRAAIIFCSSFILQSLLGSSPFSISFLRPNAYLIISHKEYMTTICDVNLWKIRPASRRRVGPNPPSTTRAHSITTASYAVGRGDKLFA